MKKRFFAAAMIAALVLTGCAGIFSDTEKEKNKPAIGDEPTQSSKAQQYYQFEAPKEGDTIAEIVVEGYGSMFIKLFPEKAPKAVENFVQHSKDGYYNGVKFHRIIADFMIQGGDPTGTGSGGDSIYGGAFADEFSPDLEPFRGALCMANAGKNTNKSQFFIVQESAAKVEEIKKYVEYKGKTLKEYFKAGYDTDLSDDQIERFLTYGGAPWLSGHHTVFGQLYKGFDVLDAISTVDTNNKNVPLKDVVIKTINITVYGKE